MGSKESLAEGQRDLEELAGVVVTPKQVERISEQPGTEAQPLFDPQLVGAADKVVPFPATQSSA